MVKNSSVLSIPQNLWSFSIYIFTFGPYTYTYLDACLQNFPGCVDSRIFDE